MPKPSGGMAYWNYGECPQNTMLILARDFHLVLVKFYQFDIYYFLLKDWSHLVIICDILVSFLVCL